MAPVPPEMLVLGRLAVDFYPEEVGARLVDAPAFRRMLGGGAANVAVAAARLGRSVGLISKVGADPFGVYVRGALDGFGVDTSRVGTHPHLRTPLVFCEIVPPADPLTLFYRQPTAPDMTLSLDEVDATEVASVPLLWATGTGVSADPSRQTTLSLLRTRDRRLPTVLDLDYRAEFWSSEEEAGRVGREAAGLATIVVGSEREGAVLLGERPPEELAKALLELGPRLAVVKLGERGARAATATERFVVPPVEVTVVDTLGAGDAFGGALCHGLLARWPLERALRFANAAGAIVATRVGCADEMPSADEVEGLVARQ
jgi:5-dehydro-2-deoxygluconokinase